MASKISDLEKERAAALDKMEAIAGKAKSEERLLTEDEKSQIAALDKAFQERDTEIARLRAEEKAQNETLAALGERRKHLDRDAENRAAPHIQVGREEGEDDKGRCIVYPNLGAQIQDVVRACRYGERIPRLERCQRIMARATGMSEGVGQDGGYFVQQDSSTKLLDRTYNEGQVGKLVTRNGVQGNGLKIPALDETSRANGQRSGGVVSYWEEEGASLTPSKPKFRIMNLSLRKLISAFVMTDDLMADAPFLASYVSNKFVDEMKFRVDDAIIRGTGAGQPLGILKSGCLIEVAAEGGQSADTIVFGNITKMEAALWAPGIANSNWLINKNVKPQLQSMVIPNSTVAVYMPPSGLAGEKYSTIYGRPSLVTEYNPKLGDVGDILLGDFTQYQLIDKNSMESAQSIHVYFLTAENVLRFIYRVDGQPLWDVPLTPYQGAVGEKESPFIALAAR